MAELGGAAPKTEWVDGSEALEVPRTALLAVKRAPDLIKRSSRFYLEMLKKTHSIFR
jgi:hypothetical protein